MRPNPGIIAFGLLLGATAPGFAQMSPWGTASHETVPTVSRPVNPAPTPMAARQATALPPMSTGHAGHGPVTLGGIEESWEQSSTPSPEVGGRAVQVQYPLEPDPYSEIERRFPPSGAASPGWPAQGHAAAPILPDEAGFAVHQHEPAVIIREIPGEVTWVIGGDKADSLGITSFDARAKIDFRDAPMLTVIPRFGWHLLDGPQITDLPSQLYDASVEAVLSLPVGDGVFIQGAVAPSIFTDGDNTSSDSFRIPARLMAFWNCAEDLTLSVGVLFLDREDVDFLPSAGLIYRPNPDVKFELMVPRPKIALKTWSDGVDEQWVYIVGEFGGGSWAIRRSFGVNDVATYGDYRAMVGWEHVSKDAVGVRVEGGYVFNRELEYVSNIGSRDLPGTGVVRFGLTY